MVQGFAPRLVVEDTLQDRALLMASRLQQLGWAQKSVLGQAAQLQPYDWAPVGMPVW